MKLGIIGKGFVGSAVANGFDKDCEQIIVDPKYTDNTIEDVLECKITFLCVPTPVSEDGSCDVSIAKDVLTELDRHQYKGVVVIKSTIIPDYLHKFKKTYDLKMVYNPEFLTEANAVNDFENQKRIILGGPKSETTKLKKIYSKVFPKAHIIKTDSKHAEMVKYLTNCFLATKVSFANEIYQVCEKLKVDYSKVVKYAVLDERLGKSHWNVPGPDGDLGFGGHCLPKDLSAFIHLAMKLDTETNVLNAVEETNDVVRKNRDWEDMKGRAVV